MRQATHLREWREFHWRDELRFRHIKIKHLRQRRRNQITPPGENPGRLRPAQSLAAGKAHQIGAFSDEAPQIFSGR